jgi:uncharacterized repeat protein (TIGR03803 family)
MLAISAPGQTLTVLHNFLTNSYRFADQPIGMVLSGNVLYGAANGGEASNGIVFSIHADGTGFATLYRFGAASDGAEPNSPMVLSGQTLYGTTFSGGASGAGVIFAVNTDGSGFTNLHSFDVGSNNGGDPRAGLVLSGNTLYGTTREGGEGNGTVFAINTDGTGFTNLYVFDAFDTNGGEPLGGLVLSSNTLYGTASLGGDSDNGTIFAVNTDGTGFTVLHTFERSDGAFPQGRLLLSGNTLYGTAYYGGIANGTVFAINSDGTGFRVLYAFEDSSGMFIPATDGGNPQAGLVLSGNTLYGTTIFGGATGYGTAFAVNTDGTGYTNLYNFTGDRTGNQSSYDLIWSSNTLYGTSSGPYFGMVFSLSLMPQLSISASGPNVTLIWPTNVAGLTLQSTPSLDPPAVWTPVSSGPVVVNGLNTVTNPMSGAQQFYRLSQ